MFGFFSCQARAFCACFAGVSMASVLHVASIEPGIVERVSMIIVQLAIILQEQCVLQKPPRRDCRAEGGPIGLARPGQCEASGSQPCCQNQAHDTWSECEVQKRVSHTRLPILESTKRKKSRTGQTQSRMLPSRRFTLFCEAAEKSKRDPSRPPSPSSSAGQAQTKGAIPSHVHLSP